MEFRRPEIKSDTVKRRIFHGPVNIAGIGRILADWQRGQGAKADFIVYVSDSPIIRNSHRSLHLESRGPLVRFCVEFLFFCRCLVRYDIFNFYFGRSLLPWGLDLPFLRLFGKKLVMIYCGSDIRLMEVERKRNPYWQLISSSQDGLQYDARKKRMMRWQRRWLHRVIAPRELYDSASQVFPEEMIEKDLWVHNLMDIGAYQPDYHLHEPPVVVHAPSHQGLKGTEYVEQAIEELRNAGVQFEYRCIEGVDNEEALRIYREEADIIVDQFLLGGFGTLAVEAMYFGKPVMCYLIDEVREEHYPDIPIVSATIDNVADKLRWLIEHPEERLRLGREGRSYVEKHFDVETINRKLWVLYQNL